MAWTVYRHITPSGKSYIGITSKKPRKRWLNGKGYNPKLPFGKAIEKYGWENIKHEILDTNIDEFEAKCLEEYYIFSYRTYVGFSDCNGYNCTLGGDGQVGFKFDESTIKRMSEAKKGKPSPRKGVTLDDETKKKIGESNKGHTAWNKGIPHTEEEKIKMSKAKKGKPSPRKGKHIVIIDGKRHYVD